MTNAANRYKRLILACAVACACAWTLPRTKPGCVLSRFNYWQFWIVVILTAICLWCGVVLTRAKSRRRLFVFRSVAIWLGVVSSLALWDVGCLLWPAGAMTENPWYVFTGQATVELPGLPFGRPAYINWHGKSRGDIAILGGYVDPYARWLSFHTDFEGFRNGRDIHKADVVFLGDSFTEAGNVPEEETFPQRVAAGLDIDCRNLGRVLYGPSLELIILKEYGLKCQPRLVVWQIAEINDLADEARHGRWIRAGRPPFLPPNRLTRRDGWRRRSPTYWVFARLREPPPWTYEGSFRDSKGQRHPMLFVTPPSRAQQPHEHPGWPIMQAALRDGIQLLRENDVRPIVLFVPIKMRVMGAAVEWSAHTQRPLTPSWDSAGPAPLAAALTRLCRELDVPLIDPTSQLQSRATSGELVFLPFDTHLSPKGHAVIADLILETVADNKLLD